MATRLDGDRLRERLAGEQARDHQGQGGILGATDRDCALQALAADDADAVHGDDFPD